MLVHFYTTKIGYHYTVSPKKAAEGEMQFLPRVGDTVSFSTWTGRVTTVLIKLDATPLDEAYQVYIEQDHCSWHMTTPYVNGKCEICNR